MNTWDMGPLPTEIFPTIESLRIEELVKKIFYMGVEMDKLRKEIEKHKAEIKRLQDALDGKY